MREVEELREYGVAVVSVFVDAATNFNFRLNDNERPRQEKVMYYF